MKETSSIDINIHRSAEIAASILQRKELGCSRARRVSTIEEERAFGSSRAERDFWAALGTTTNTNTNRGEPIPQI